MLRMVPAAPFPLSVLFFLRQMYLSFIYYYTSQIKKDLPLFVNNLLQSCDQHSDKKNSPAADLLPGSFFKVVLPCFLPPAPMMPVRPDEKGGETPLFPVLSYDASYAQIIPGPDP